MEVYKMKKHTPVLLVALTILIAFAADTANAADNVSSMTNVYDVVGTNFKWGSNEQYPVIDLFGEKDVPLFTTNGNIWDAHVNKFAKLIIDNNEPHTLRDGEKLDLGHGYALEAKQTNIHNRKIWLEFTKDGQHIADQIVSVNEEKTWNVTLDNVQGENDIIVMRVHVNSAFTGIEDFSQVANNITDTNAVDIEGVDIDGIWLIDFVNARTLKMGDKIGEFTLKQIVKESNLSNQESLVFKNNMGFTVTCNAVGTNYQCYSWSNQYPLINLFGEKDVPLLANKDPLWKCHVEKLAKLVLDSNEKSILKTGEKIELGQGYSIQVKEIDIGGKKVWLEFDKNGKYVSDDIVSTDENWIYSLNNIQGEDNIPVLRVYVSDVHQSVNDSIVQIEGVWLIDYEKAITLKIGEKLGECTLEKIVPGTNSSNPGSLVFNKTQEVDFSSSNLKKEPFNAPDKGHTVSANKSKGPSISWLGLWKLFT
jgi:S-layer protein (TIGR01567 family)